MAGWFRQDVYKRQLLMMPDLFNYYLSGGKCCEYSIASTTQMLDAVKKNWSDEVIEKMCIRDRLRDDDLEF